MARGCSPAYVRVPEAAWIQQGTSFVSPWFGSGRLREENSPLLLNAVCRWVYCWLNESKELKTLSGPTAEGLRVMAQGPICPQPSFAPLCWGWCGFFKSHPKNSGIIKRNSINKGKKLLCCFLGGKYDVDIRGKQCPPPVWSSLVLIGSTFSRPKVLTFGTADTNWITLHRGELSCALECLPASPASSW